MSDDVIEVPAAEMPEPTPGAIHVMDNGIVRDATPEEIAEIELRRQQAAANPPPDALLAESIPMLNLQLILIDDGHLLTVEQMLEAMSGDDGLRARALWNKAETARRDNWLVEMMWPQLYTSEADFNDAWRRAAALNP